VPLEDLQDCDERRCIFALGHGVRDRDTLSSLILANKQGKLIKFS
jgi:hypothetical protein